MTAYIDKPMRHVDDGNMTLDTYRPRRARFQEVMRVGSMSIKVNAICADGKAIDDGVLNKAKARIIDAEPEMMRTPQLGAGFAILHEGEEGRWLLLHWWLGGGICARKLWRADLAPDAEFEDAPPHLFACVWELAIIDFERCAWTETAMSHKPVSDYIARRFSGETV
ncbi:hypothetical protein ACFOEZ_14410 [Tianweitania populi]|uniref:Uncharacterized protein n=1 Tax=Tianweitania populi TaxID=1607949 RepID=A0A8J3DQI8_9HYPH|nr:hypothetical protein [Tianweitania populi]GHD17136.1 hypothetical protein GCM10016234_25990 [Tianweitania populi]